MGVMVGPAVATQASAAIAVATTEEAASSAASDQLQKAAARTAQRLKAAEEKTARCEVSLAECRVSEAASEQERTTLRQRLKENESLIKGLTDQLDAVNAQLQAQARLCQELEE